MRQIQETLPCSMELRRLNPRLEQPLVPSEYALVPSEYTKVRALVRISQGWHMLNEARSALVEAAACKVFYEDCEPDPIEAIYRCRFYLDDAALRLYSSCEHLLMCVTFYWGLSVPHSREAMLVRVIKAAEKSNLPEVSGDVSTSLRGLAQDWNECRKYRNEWVHNERPAIDGLDWEMSFTSWRADNIPDISPAILNEMGWPTKTSGKVLRIGTGRKIDDLHQVIKNAYCQLFSVYERFAEMLN